jgi:hypothetical protein
MALVQGLSQLVLGLALPSGIAGSLSRLITTFWGPQISVFVSRRTLRALSRVLVDVIVKSTRFALKRVTGHCNYQVSACVGGIDFFCAAHNIPAINDLKCSKGRIYSACDVKPKKIFCAKHNNPDVELVGNVYKCKVRTYTCKAHKSAIKSDLQSLPDYCNDDACFEKYSFASRSDALATAALPETSEEKRALILEMCEPPSIAHAALYKIYDNMNRLDRFLDRNPQLTHLMSDIGITGYLTLFDQPEPTWQDVIADPRRLLEDPRSWFG